MTGTTTSTGRERFLPSIYLCVHVRLVTVSAIHSQRSSLVFTTKWQLQDSASRINTRVARGVQRPALPARRRHLTRCVVTQVRTIDSRHGLNESTCTTVEPSSCSAHKALDNGPGRSARLAVGHSHHALVATTREEAVDLVQQQATAAACNAVRFRTRYVHGRSRC